MKDLFKMLRVKHYLKNFLVFLPLVFSTQLLNKDKLIATTIGTITFCFLASAIYIINDIRDIEKDKKHPIKKDRPIASGRISKKVAICISIVLIVLCLVLNWLMFYTGKINDTQLMFGVAIELLYLVINIFYSFGLKNVIILDVSIIVLGFLLRVLYGTSITDIAISNWLYLTIMSGAFYMGFGKRRNEFVKSGDKSRTVLKGYNKEFLDKFMYICLVLSVVFYSLWCIDSVTISRVGNNYLIYTVPFLLIILMKYSLDTELEESFGDPVDVILNDKILMLLVFLFALVILGIIYIF